MRHNGTRPWYFDFDEDGEVGAVNWILLSIGDVVDTWRFKRTLGQEDPRLPLRDLGFDIPDPVELPIEWIPNDSVDGFSERTYGVKADRWNPRWIPIADNGCGDNLFLDLDPDEGGRFGQIADWWHEGARTRLVAHSFVDWLEDVAERMNRRNARIQCDKYL